MPMGMKYEAAYSTSPAVYTVRPDDESGPVCMSAVKGVWVCLLRWLYIGVGS